MSGKRFTAWRTIQIKNIENPQQTHLVGLTQARHNDVHVYHVALQHVHVHEPLSDQTGSTAGREQSMCTLYCYSSALPNGIEYAEIIYFPI